MRRMLCGVEVAGIGNAQSDLLFAPLPDGSQRGGAHLIQSCDLRNDGQGLWIDRVALRMAAGLRRLFQPNTRVIGNIQAGMPVKDLVLPRSVPGIAFDYLTDRTSVLVIHGDQAVGGAGPHQF